MTKPFLLFNAMVCNECYGVLFLSLSVSFLPVFFSRFLKIPESSKISCWSLKSCLLVVSEITCVCVFQSEKAALLLSLCSLAVEPKGTKCLLGIVMFVWSALSAGVPESGLSVSQSVNRGRSPQRISPLSAVQQSVYIFIFLIKE